MASGGVDLRVRISSDLSDIKQGLGQLRSELAKVKADAAKTTPDTTAWAAGLGNIRQQLGNVAGAYVGLQTVTAGIHALFDAVDRMDAIDEMAQSSGVSAAEMSKLAYAAQFSSVELGTLGKGLTKLAKDMTSNKSLLAEFGIAITDSAGNARSTNDVLIDLAGVFEQLPDGAEKSALAAKLFGDRIGPGLIPLLNTGKQGLIDLGVEAEKTGSVFDDAAAAAGGRFNDQLDKLKSQAQGLANETAKRLIPAFSGYAEALVESGNASGMITGGGEAIATALKAVAIAVIIAKNAWEGFLNVLFFVGDAVAEVGSAIGGTLTRNVGNFVGFFTDVAGGKNPLKAFRERTADSLAGMVGDTRTAINGIRAGYSAMKDGLAESGADIARIRKMFSDGVGQGEQAANGIGNAAAGATPQANALLSKVRGLLGDDGDGEKKSKTQEKIERIAESTVLLQDEVKRAQKALDEQFADGAIGATAYYAQRVALQQQLIDLQIRQLQGELAITDGLARRRQIEEQITILQRDRQQASSDAARDQQQAAQKASAALGQGLRDRSSALTGGLSAQEQSISAQIAAGTLGSLEGERRLAEVRATALEQLRALRNEQAAYLASMSPNDPAIAQAREGLLGIDTAIAETIASMQQMRQDTLDVGVSALTGFFGSLRDGATSAGDAFRVLVSDFAKGIYDMLAQATAKRLVGAIADLFGGGGGEQPGVQQGAVALTGAATATAVAGGAISAGAVQLSAAAAQVLAAAGALATANTAGGLARFGLAHGGGVAGALRMSRAGVDPLLFAAAPRYHMGGVVGLRDSSEIPAILQRGEVVRTRQQEAALQARMNAGSGSAGPPVRNIIVFSDAELAGALSGAEGERVIVNHVRRNRGGVDA